MTSLSKTCSSISMVVLHSRIYTERAILSGMIATVRIISEIRAERLIGSPPASANNNFVLKRMKSVSFWLINSANSLALWLRANESGSSPAGRSTTLTFIPSSNNISIPRRAALIPAASPSYNTVILFVKRCMSRICPCVSAVPEEATTFSTPTWCIPITSIYPSTKKQRSCFMIACLAK